LPDAKIAVLYENDDLGKDYLVGLREGLGSDADRMMIAAKSYELSDPTVDSQIIALHDSAKAIGIISAGFLKDPTDPRWQDTFEYKEWLAWMKAYNTSADTADNLNVVGYTMQREDLSFLDSERSYQVQMRLLARGPRTQGCFSTLTRAC
jgi:branched-chain amino acid transport system substrate-binding protein